MLPTSKLDAKYLAVHNSAKAAVLLITEARWEKELCRRPRRHRGPQHGHEAPEGARDLKVAAWGNGGR